MELKQMFSLLGGLGLFLYGMNLMSTAVTDTARPSLVRWIRRATCSPLRALLTGAWVTAVIQSSSAATVMVVGLVSAGVMDLDKAFPLMLGADIGTTVTGQIMAFELGEYAPLAAFLGILPLLFSPKTPVKTAGEVLTGFGMLFMGMGMMSAATEPLKAHPGFLRLITNSEHPALGVVLGGAATAVIQSSSAAVGLVQTLAEGGRLGLMPALYLVVGANIGTCITCILAAAGRGTDAKRAALLHLMTKLIGAAAFAMVLPWLPVEDWLLAAFPGRVKAQIAVFHTAFNVINSFLMLPVRRRMVCFACRMLPHKMGYHGRTV